MNPGRRNLLMGAAVAAVAAAAGAGLALYRASSERESAALRNARFLDLQGNERSLTELQGQFLLVNFWATWCAPCLEEIPMLSELRRLHAGRGFEIVGIAIDQSDKVREMAAKLSIRYPVFLADVRGLQLLRELGNSSGGLPYSVLLDPNLQPSARKLGALKRAEAEAMLSRALGG
jgi:thiol-disulfide isomerase/thioredoxin